MEVPGNTVCAWCNFSATVCVVVVATSRLRHVASGKIWACVGRASCDLYTVYWFSL